MDAILHVVSAWALLGVCLANAVQLASLWALVCAHPSVCGEGSSVPSRPGRPQPATTRKASLEIWREVIVISRLGCSGR